ncbi:hypothetical protein SAMN05428975_3118 [Mucilaginibacter sp. OK268]|uniref:hypothetical protein n=1 Tax=Mucilaginibacter sp. OK268 TaxID=1881048 RepID=UPI00089168BC|nr:hypothetical protein [Mucilaginibacter sp. OK268]SDP86294.1 hypothetical protein SAMN05428975_3118 [Mucilaginibacter sp. OK268]
MKKLNLIILALLFVSPFARAQWTTGTNIYNTNTGNVGIGSNNPNAKLTIYQSTSLGSVAKNNMLLSSTGGAAVNNVQNNVWLVRNAAGSDFTTARLHDAISIDGSYITPQTDTRTWWERDPTTDVQSWGSAASTYLTLKQGNLGIGTIAPAAKLDITVSSSSLTNNIRFGDATPGYLAAGTNGIYLSNNSGTAVFTVLHGGNVGIGTLIPQNKLDVNGTIHAKQVNIDLSGWSDYVFKKDYPLLPLIGVKDYIDKNQHLPGIPSEQEMIKNGLNVGEMNQLLMKKVEELTLYLIEKDRKEKEQEIKLQNQDERIHKLEEVLLKMTKPNN